MTTEEKFHAAVNVIRSLPKNGSYQPSNELMLRFYAYFKQATLGPCKGARPAFWDVVGRAKYDAWKNLGEMSKQEAMNNYVAELHRIVETMSYTDNVANFLEAQTELESVSLNDLELVAGDVIERVRSQPNSPFASREASPQRVRSSVETSPTSSASTSPPPPIIDHPDTDHSDDEYIDTVDSEPDLNSTNTKKTIPNGHIPEVISNGYGSKEPYVRASRSKIKIIPNAGDTTDVRVDISQEVLRTIQNLRADLERLSSKVNTLEKKNSSAVVKKGTFFTLKNVSPGFLAFIILWPFITHSLLRYWSNRK